MHFQQVDFRIDYSIQLKMGMAMEMAKCWECWHIELMMSTFASNISMHKRIIYGKESNPSFHMHTHTRTQTHYQLCCVHLIACKWPHLRILCKHFRAFIMFLLFANKVHGALENAQNSLKTWRCDKEERIIMIENQFKCSCTHINRHDFGPFLFGKKEG